MCLVDPRTLVVTQTLHQLKVGILSESGPVENNVIRIKYMKAKIDKTHKNNKCR